MHGNVFEFCQDWFAEDYYGQSPELDPQGPRGGTYRVVRGGSWHHPSSHCRSSFRGKIVPRETGEPGGPRYLADVLGFRVAAVPLKQEQASE